MIEIKQNHIDKIFIDVCKKLEKSGEIRIARNLKVIELNNAWICLTNPNNNKITLPERKLSHYYLDEELIWYLSGSLKTKDISHASNFWNTLADENGTINSNYGAIALYDKYNGKSQLTWCIDRLKEDKYTRQAIINYNQPKYKYEGNKDFVCTISQQFIIRKNKLDSILLMRSNDLVYGFSYDVPWFCYLLKIISDLTNIPIGNYYHYAASLHVYEKHFGMLSKICKKY